MTSPFILMAAALTRTATPVAFVCMALVGIWGIFLQLVDGEIRLRGKAVWGREDDRRKFWAIITLESTAVFSLLILLVLPFLK